MQMLDKSAAESIAKALKLNKNMQKLLVAPVCSADWAEYELLSISTKGGNAGICLLNLWARFMQKCTKLALLRAAKRA